MKLANSLKKYVDKEKYETLEDLMPVIELYHRLVKGGKYDEAIDLYFNRIDAPVSPQLSDNQLRLEFLEELFPQGQYKNRMPLIKNESNLGFILNELANAYAASGQPKKSAPLFLDFVRISEKSDDVVSLGSGLGNTATDQLLIGQISASAAHLRKLIAIFIEIKDEYWEADGRQKLGHVLAFNGSPCAEEELAKSTAYWEKTDEYEVLSQDFSYRSLSALLQARLAMIVPREGKLSPELNLEALFQARKALAFAVEDAITAYPFPRDFVQAYWLLGETLIHRSMDHSTNVNPIESFNISFYDEGFQEIIEHVKVKKGMEFNAAERCLNEALRRCREINIVDYEPDILLALARLEFVRNQTTDLTHLKEAMDIALRSGYRLKLADIHLFCGQTLLQLKTTNNLLGFTAAEHLQKTKEYAMDVSDISNLYAPVKTTADEFYKDIPEYDMLKRGMTEKERVKNGYYMAYLIAETLLNIIH